MLKIVVDRDPVSPRSWDNLGVMICSHRRYTLGDKHFDSSQFSGWEEAEAHFKGIYDSVLSLPIYMYDHSGITISTTPFSCPWDSGKIGFILLPQNKISEIADYTQEKGIKHLQLEVQVYDEYLRGEVYGFVEDDDSCFGFYGSDHRKSGLYDHLSTAAQKLFDAGKYTVEGF